MKEWKKLDIGNLPSDILVGDYEVEVDLAGDWRRSETFYNEKGNGRTLVLENLMHAIPKYRYRKTQPKAPTHEEIMSKWWEDKNRGWSKVIAYNKGNYMVIYYARLGGYETASRWKDWFTDKKSADIPPEKDQS